MTTAGATADSTISEQEWNRMLRRIEDRKVIPVIGEQLTVMRNSAGAELSLAEHLFTELDLKGPPPTSLNELALRYLEVHPRHSEDLYADVFQVLQASSEMPIPKPLRQLAEIRDFDLFVSTSFDPYLAHALNEVRFGRRSSGSTRVLAYESNLRVDVPERFAQIDYPLVYHLFGKAQAAPLFALTDEDVLEYVHTLQAPECVPPNLFSALRQQRLLVLGTRLSGWLTRFFLRVSSADRLRDARRADYVIESNHQADPEQALFFENFGEVKLLKMPACEFIDELHSRWKARRPQTRSAATVAPSATQSEGLVFISYASEDLSIARELRERIEMETGVRVWLDKEALRGGENWEARINDVLRGCSVCVPLISANVKGRTYRFVRTEWKQAVQLQAGRNSDTPFIRPLVIDDTRADDPALEPEIRALHWRRLRDDTDMQLFLRELKS